MDYTDFVVNRAQHMRPLEYDLSDSFNKLVRYLHDMGILDNVPVATLGPASVLNASDALAAPLRSLVVGGNSTQDGTPTPSEPVPIVSVAAANLVDYLTNYYAAAVRLVDGKLVNEVTDSKTFATPIIQTMLNGTVQEAFYFSNQNVTDAGTYGRSFTTTKEFDTVRIKHNGSIGDVTFLQQGLSGKAGSDYYATITFDGTNPSVAGGIVACNIALYDGLQSRAYTPYGHAGLWTRGKNLLLGTNYLRYQLDSGITWTVNADGSVHAKGTSTSTSQVYWYVPAADAQSFGGMVLSGAPNVSGCSVRFEMRATPYTVYAADTTGAGATINIPSSGAADASLMCRVDSGKTVDVTFRPMIRLAGTDAAYQPYAATVMPIPLDGHELRSLPDGTRDEVTVGTDGHVTLVQRVGEVTFDGMETWNRNVVQSVYRFSTNAIANTVVKPSSDEVLVPLFCSQFESKTASWVIEPNVGIGVTTSGNVTVYHPDYQDLETWTAHLVADPMTVLYPLATPVTHDLGEIELSSVVGPSCTICAIADATPTLTAQYVRDISVTINDMQEAIADL